MWIVAFSAQVSASCQSRQHITCEGDTQIHLSKTNYCLGTNYKQTSLDLCVVWIVAFPAQASASCRSTPAHNL